MNEEQVRRYIELPTDEVLRSRLNAKLSEYQARIWGKGLPWEGMHAIVAYQSFQEYRRLCYREQGLRTAMRSRVSVDTRSLIKEAHNRWGSAFNMDDLENTCIVVDYYCGNLSDEEVQIEGGTGLPPVK